MTEPVFAAESARLLIAAAARIILLLLLIIKFKIHPILSLLISALVVDLEPECRFQLCHHSGKRCRDTLRNCMLLVDLALCLGGILEKYPEVHNVLPRR